MTRRFASIFGAAILLAAAAQAARAESEPATFSILFENDVFFNTDRDYTNGVQLAYTTGPDRNYDWAVDAARALPFFAPSGEVRTSYALGQNIYTPKDTDLVNPPLTERPYAGFLYGALGLMEQNDTRLDQLQLQLGVIGPASLAEDAQKMVHSIIHDAKPKGWHTQLRDEPGLELTYERSLKLIPPQSLLGLVLDAEPHFGGAVGNVYDYVNVGAMVRFGFNLPDDYGPLRIEPGLPGSNFFKSTGDFSAYVFAGVDGRALARNIFLDGNTWQDSRSVVKKNLVGDLELGAAVTVAHARLAFTHVFRSREYGSQTTADQFGALSLTFGL
jgi:hypothetical protein